MSQGRRASGPAFQSRSSVDDDLEAIVLVFMSGSDVGYWKGKSVPGVGAGFEG